MVRARAASLALVACMRFSSTSKFRQSQVNDHQSVYVPWMHALAGTSTDKWHAACSLGIYSFVYPLSSQPFHIVHFAWFAAVDIMVTGRELFFWK